MGMANLHIDDLKIVEIGSGQILSDIDFYDGYTEFVEPTFADKSDSKISAFDNSATISFETKLEPLDGLHTFKNVLCSQSTPTQIEFESKELADIKQARKHRKRRINKKWLKRYGVVPIYKTVKYIGDIADTRVNSAPSDKEHPRLDFEYKLTNIRVKKNY